MEIDNELKETDFKNCTCYCFDDIININDLDLDIILLDEKSYKNFLIYVAYETLYGVRPLHIIFEKVDGYIRKYDGTKYLALFHSDESYERIFDKIRYPVMLKSNISDVSSHKFMKIQINSDDDLPLEKTLNIHNVAILFKSLFNKIRNHYYYHKFLEKFSDN